MEFRDREGRLIDAYTWAMLFEDEDYHIVAYDQLGAYAVSTIWLGFDHNARHVRTGEGEPHYFESALRIGDRIDICQRTPTEAAALETHRALLGRIAAAVNG